MNSYQTNPSFEMSQELLNKCIAFRQEFTKMPLGKQKRMADKLEPHELMALLIGLNITSINELTTKL